MKIGTPLKQGGTRLLLLGSGELGKEVAIEAQRLGVEVIAVDRYPDAPAMQVAHRSHVISMLDKEELARVIRLEQPTYIVPEIEAIDTLFLLELEQEGFIVIPTARATNFTMNREGIKPEIMDGRVYGYQCEVDPSARAWSAGIYDEARRGWLYTGELNPSGKSAFKPNEWNHYRIECIGNSIRTWLNNIPVACLIDDMTPSGLIALQVHAIGKDDQPGKQIRWKNIRIKTTGLKVTDTPYVFVVNLVPNTLCEAEKQQGWHLLFDGKTTSGWKAVGKDQFPEQGWTVEDGALKSIASTESARLKGSDIISDEKFAAFEFQFEFNFTEGANSGVKYFTGNGGSSIGLEYQVLDDKNHPDAKMGIAGNRTLASLYDLIPANKQERFVKPFGEWNIGRIVVYPDNRVEHWLNGIKVLEYVRGSESFKALVSKSKFAGFENFGMVKEAPILLQYHSDQVKFRSLKIRKI